MKKLLTFFFTVIIVLFATSCSGNDDTVIDNGGNGDNNVIIETTRKIYYEVEYVLYFDDISEGISRINNQVIELNGYIESSVENMSDYRYADIVYRIKTEDLNNFLNFIDETNVAKSKTVSSTDITTEYVETEERLNTLYASKTAYVKLLNEANLSIQDIIDINSHIEKIDTEIKSLETQKAQYDNLLDYSTVTIRYRTEESDNNSFFSEYGNYLKNFFIVLFKIIMYVLPFIVIGGTVGLIIVLVDKKKKSNNKTN